ncbi:DUF1540 domain-containing protein [Hazenella coriacea]|uniref:Uncharacterized protein DUF1540 n=1 Tax=Hazenella coriacea TaxID=1179467 RepID=A0A4R3L7Q1_9BACL|nr:DUF1540 domain-containing protein [Hazenella coriacea]TCS95065.1 uncharacterized protein DUF1540 [Hazenella coriacea]
MPRDVMCEVNNCVYWGQGNLCEAEQIYVVSQQGELASDQAETDCYTFEKKD